jgi:hypothetical protein
MTPDNKRPVGLYTKYLLRLAERRAADEPPLPDICGNEYWDLRRKNHAAVPRRRNRTPRTELRKDYDK